MYQGAQREMGDWVRGISERHGVELSERDVEYLSEATIEGLTQIAEMLNGYAQKAAEQGQGDCTEIYANMLKEWVDSITES